MTWPISGKPAGWNRSPAIGSSVAVRTSGDSPFNTSVGVSFFGGLFFSASDMCFSSLWPASRTKPAFEQDRPIAARQGEQKGRDEPVRRVRSEGQVVRGEPRVSHRVAAAREPEHGVEGARAGRRDEGARSFRRACARLLSEQVVASEVADDQGALIDER